MIFLHAISDWLAEHMLTCPSVKWLGIICPGCGMQRSFIALTEGRILDSLTLYPALLPLIGLGIVLVSYLLQPTTIKAKIIVGLQLISGIIIIVNYIIKLHQNLIV